MPFRSFRKQQIEDEFVSFSPFEVANAVLVTLAEKRVLYGFAQELGPGDVTVAVFIKQIEIEGDLYGLRELRPQAGNGRAEFPGTDGIALVRIDLLEHPSVERLVFKRGNPVVAIRIEGARLRWLKAPHYGKGQKRAPQYSAD